MDDLRINIGPWRHEYIYMFPEIDGLQVSHQNNPHAFFVETAGWLAVYTAIIPDHDSPAWQRCSRFVEIPKTGSRSIVDALSKQFGNSGPFRSYGHMYGRNFPEWMWPELKTVVRNPYDRLVSAYYFIKRGGFYQNERYKEITAKFPTFQSFVLDYLDETFMVYDADVSGTENSWKNAPWRELMIPQVEWICDEGKLILDPANIARFESFDSEVARVFDIQDAEKKNVSTDKSPWQSYYDSPDVARKVYELYRADFLLLDYPEAIFAP